MSKEIENGYRKSFRSETGLPRGKRPGIVTDIVATVPFKVGRLEAGVIKEVCVWRHF